MLFITNGDSAAGRIAASVLEGEILPWRGIDRWLGGVHLGGETLWRWDRSTQTLKRDAA